MSTPSANPTPITPPRVALIDQRTGLIDRAWYMYFLSLFNASQAALDGQNTGPSAVSLVASLEDAIERTRQELQTQPSSVVEQIAPLLDSIAQRLDTLPSAATLDEIAQLKTDIQALALAPANTPQLLRQRYGSFYDTTTQTITATDTPYPMILNSTDLSVGVAVRGEVLLAQEDGFEILQEDGFAIRVSAAGEEVEVDTAGIYNIQFSAQLDNTSGGAHLAYIWLRVNGADVPNSASQVRLKGNDGELVAAWNFLHAFDANDYFQLMWAASDTSVQLLATAASSFCPAIPSVILTVTDNISPHQY